MAYPLEHSIDVNDVFSELNPSRIGLGGLGRLRCAPANRRDKYEFVTLPKRITLFYVLLINGKGMRLGQTNQRGYRPTRRFQTSVGVVPSETSSLTLCAPIASRYEANARTEIHIIRRF